ncbi:MAG: tetratricopeptide repeat protein [Armatimonadetes bacterium]|nr:tetratricopeptide repeat protein [Armatimonadota bacterium]
MHEGPEDSRAWAEVARVCEVGARFEDAIAALEQAQRYTRDGAVKDVYLRQRAILAASIGRVRAEALLQSPKQLDKLAESLRAESMARHLDRCLRAAAPGDRGADGLRPRVEKLLAQARATVRKAPERAMDRLLDALRLMPASGFEVGFRCMDDLLAEGREADAEAWLACLAETTLEIEVLERLVSHYRTVPAARPDQMAARRERLEQALAVIARLYPSRLEARAEWGRLAAERGDTATATRLRDGLFAEGHAYLAERLDTVLWSLHGSRPTEWAASSSHVARASRFGITEEEALLAFEDALAANPRDLRAGLGLVRIFVSRGMLPEAIQTARAAFGQEPRSLEAARLLAQVWLDSGVAEKALHAALYVVGRWPHPEGWRLLADAAEAANHAEWAILARRHADAPDVGIGGLEEVARAMTAPFVLAP